MTIKHTPGPWKVGPTFEDGDIQILIPNELGTVAMVHNHAVTASDPDTMEAQAIANATLISAAPDLLSVCRRLERFLANHRYPELQGIADENAKAIAKAEDRHR